MLLHYANLLPSADVRLFLSLAAGYIALRWVEAYGLWKGKAWAEWLGAVSGGIYVPLELEHLIRAPSAISASVLSINLLVVIFLALQLWRRRPAPAIASGPSIA